MGDCSYSDYNCDGGTGRICVPGGCDCPLGTEWSVGEGACLTIRSTSVSAPSNVQPGESFVLGCTVSPSQATVWPSGSASGSCSWAGWSGNTAQFMCSAPSSQGSYNIGCDLDDSQSYADGSDPNLDGIMVALPSLTISSVSSPASVSPGSAFSFSCATNPSDVGGVYNTGTAASSCSFTGWSGGLATFSCTATASAGTYSIGCVADSSMWSSSPRTNSITVALPANSVSLVGAPTGTISPGAAFSYNCVATLNPASYPVYAWTSAAFSAAGGSCSYRTTTGTGPYSIIIDCNAPTSAGTFTNGIGCNIDNTKSTGADTYASVSTAVDCAALGDTYCCAGAAAALGKKPPAGSTGAGCTGFCLSSSCVDCAGNPNPDACYPAPFNSFCHGGVCLEAIKNPVKCGPYPGPYKNCLSTLPCATAPGTGCVGGACTGVNCWGAWNGATCTPPNDCQYAAFNASSNSCAIYNKADNTVCTSNPKYGGSSGFCCSGQCKDNRPSSDPSHDYTCCNGDAVTTQTNSSNCGSCGYACNTAGGRYCSNSICTCGTNLPCGLDYPGPGGPPMTNEDFTGCFGAVCPECEYASCSGTRSVMRGVGPAITVCDDNDPDPATNYYCAPTAVAPLGPPPTVCIDRPDGTSCSGGTCNGGVCCGAGCTIAGVCYANGVDNPLNSCQYCNSATPNAWSNRANGLACDPDSFECTSDVCNAGVCTHSSKAAGTACRTTGRCDGAQSCLDSSCGASVVPAKVVAGQAFTGTRTVTNTGEGQWTTAAGFKLGSQNAQDNIRWGFNRVALPSSPINPAQSTTFSIAATAPTVPGTYAFDWKPLKEGITWFGPTCSASIIVTCDNDSDGYNGSYTGCTNQLDCNDNDNTISPGILENTIARCTDAKNNDCDTGTDYDGDTQGTVVPKVIGDNTCTVSVLAIAMPGKVALNNPFLVNCTANTGQIRSLSYSGTAGVTCDDTSWRWNGNTVSMNCTTTVTSGTITCSVNPTRSYSAPPASQSVNFLPANVVNCDQDNDLHNRTGDPVCTYAVGKGDCNDNNPNVHPDIVETGAALCANMIDDDCDNEADYAGNVSLPHGDNGCPIDVTAVRGESLACVGASGTADLNCTYNVPGVGSALAFIKQGALAKNCTVSVWDGAVAKFVCPTAGFAAGAATLNCSVNTSRSYMTPPDMQTSITLVGTGGLGEGGCVCMADGSCPLCDADGDKHNTTAYPAYCFGINDDCDDTNPAIYPGATRVCGNGVSESCDGIDPACKITWTGYINDSTDGSPITRIGSVGVDSIPSTAMTYTIVPSGAQFSVQVDWGYRKLSANASGYDPTVLRDQLFLVSPTRQDITIRPMECQPDCTFGGYCDYSCLGQNGCVWDGILDADDQADIRGVCADAPPGDVRLFNDTHYVICCGADGGFVEMSDYRAGFSIETCNPTIIRTSRMVRYNGKFHQLTILTSKGCEE